MQERLHKLDGGGDEWHHRLIHSTRRRSNITGTELEHVVKDSFVVQNGQSENQQVFQMSLVV